LRHGRRLLRLALFLLRWPLWCQALPPRLLLWLLLLRLLLVLLLWAAVCIAVD
jgi:hypothetical protein